jgi:hypothetical protein
MLTPTLTASQKLPLFTREFFLICPAAVSENRTYKAAILNISLGPLVGGELIITAKLTTFPHPFLQPAFFSTQLKEKRTESVITKNLQRNPS